MDILVKDKLRKLAFFIFLYFVAIGLGVLVGYLFDQRGNMFYAPAFSALFGASIYFLLLKKLPQFGAISSLGIFIGLFFLLSRHGFGAFLPGVICGLLADVLAGLGKYQKSSLNRLSFFIFSFATTGPILLMWLAPGDYQASLLARGKSAAYIAKVMLPADPAIMAHFFISIVLGASLGILIGQVFLRLSNKKDQKEL